MCNLKSKVKTPKYAGDSDALRQATTAPLHRHRFTFYSYSPTSYAVRHGMLQSCWPFKSDINATNHVLRWWLSNLWRPVALMVLLLLQLSMLLSAPSLTLHTYIHRYILHIWYICKVYCFLLLLLHLFAACWQLFLMFGIQSFFTACLVDLRASLSNFSYWLISVVFVAALFSFYLILTFDKMCLVKAEVEVEV